MLQKGIDSRSHGDRDLSSAHRSLTSLTSSTSRGHRHSRHMRPADPPQNAPRHPRRRRRENITTSIAICALLAGTTQTAMAQTCIPLTDSTECPSFSAASVTTDDNVASLFPFLYQVTDTESFDSSLRDYIARNYTQQQYVSHSPM